MDWLDKYFSKNELKQIKKLKFEISLLEYCNTTLRDELLRLKQPIINFNPKIKSISQSGIKHKIQALFKNVKFIWNDVSYSQCSISDFKLILKEDKTNYIKYVKETFDCENFAELFKSRMALNYGINAVGQVMNYRGGHAFNIIVCTDGVFLLEPQSDKIWSASTNQNNKSWSYIVDGATIDI